MMKMSSRAIATGTVCLGFGLEAMAQDQDFTLERDVPRVERVSVEVQPIPIALSAVPGFGGFGAGVEGRLTNNIAVHVDATYADMNLNSEWIDEAVRETGEPVPEGGYAYSVGFGLRYYDDPIGDSVYVGAAAAYGEGHNDWTYEDNQTYDVEAYTLTPSVSAGYRWVWRNGVLLRLGAGAGAPRVNGLTISGNNPGTVLNEEGKNKIDDLLNQTVIARVDLGLGYTF